MNHLPYDRAFELLSQVADGHLAVLDSHGNSLAHLPEEFHIVEETHLFLGLQCGKFDALEVADGFYEAVYQLLVIGSDGEQLRFHLIEVAPGVPLDAVEIHLHKILVLNHLAALANDAHVLPDLMNLLCWRRACHPVDTVVDMETLALPRRALTAYDGMSLEYLALQSAHLRIYTGCKSRYSASYYYYFRHLLLTYTI